MPAFAESYDSVAANVDGNGQLHELARAKIKARLLTDLQRYFEYPLIARREGWQGTVQLSVTVEPDGTLDRIHIARSSGYEVLDNSALNATRRIKRLTEAGYWLDGRELEIPLPVIYRLVER